MISPESRLAYCAATTFPMTLDNSKKKNYVSKNNKGRPRDGHGMTSALTYAIRHVHIDRSFRLTGSERDSWTRVANDSLLMSDIL